MLRNKRWWVKRTYTDPTIVPTPTSVCTATPATEVNNSGALLPAAMNVAPATSSLRLIFSLITSREGTKKSSQIKARAKGVGIRVMCNGSVGILSMAYVGKRSGRTVRRLDISIMKRLVLTYGLLVKSARIM